MLKNSLDVLGQFRKIKHTKRVSTSFFFLFSGGKPYFFFHLKAIPLFHILGKIRSVFIYIVGKDESFKTGKAENYVVSQVPEPSDLALIFVHSD